MKKTRIRRKRIGAKKFGSSSDLLQPNNESAISDTDQNADHKINQTSIEIFNEPREEDSDKTGTDIQPGNKNNLIS